MAIKKIKYKDHEDWLAKRASLGIGGSDAASVAGMSPYRSALQLYAEKVGLIEPFEGNMITEVGAYLEDFVAHKAAEQLGKKVRRENHILVNDKYPWAFANIDRAIVGENAFMEIKTTNSIPIMKALRKGGDQFPEAYLCQCVHYMAVGEFDHCYLAVLVNCRELLIYEMDRDEDEIKALMDMEQDFWRHVQTKTQPEPDGSQSASETLKLLYPESTADKVNLFGFDTALDQYMRIGKEIKELKALQDEAANKVKAFMQEAGKGESARYRVSYATQSRRTFDYKALEKDNHAIDLSKYYKVSESRVFKVTEK